MRALRWWSLGDREELAALRAELAEVRVQMAGMTAAVAQLATANAALVVLATRAPAQTAPVVAASPAPAIDELLWEDAWKPYVAANGDRIASSNTDSGRWAHWARHNGKKRVVDTDLNMLVDYRTARRGETTKRKGPPAPKSINNETELARRVARWLFRKKRVSRDPFAVLTQEELFEPVENVRRNIIEDDPEHPMSLERLLEQADELDRALVLTAHSGGMRRNEIAQMELPWIDRTPDSHGRALRIVEIPPGISKGKRGKRHGRQTFISVEALAAIDAYRRTLPLPLQRRGVHVFVNAQTSKDGQPGRYFGKHLHKDYLTERFRRLQERAGMSGPSGAPWLHDLRRSFATLSRRRGEDTSNIMAAMGQTTLSTFQRYDIHARKDAIEVRDRVEAARAKELAALEASRRGPKRAESAVSTCGEKNKTG